MYKYNFFQWVIICYFVCSVFYWWRRYKKTEESFNKLLKAANILSDMNDCIIDDNIRLLKFYNEHTKEPFKSKIYYCLKELRKLN